VAGPTTHGRLLDRHRAEEEVGRLGRDVRQTYRTMTKPTDYDVNLGFKRLTPQNWLATDPTTEFWGGDPQHLAVDVLAPRLGTHVPRAVHRKFETARAAMVYAGFFHPLYALGYEQLFRVSETAARLRCEELGGPHTKGFEKVVNWLVKRGEIDEWDVTLWPQLIKARDATTHGRDQWQVPADNGRAEVEGFVKRIDRLFASKGV